MGYRSTLLGLFQSIENNSIYSKISGSILYLEIKLEIDYLFNGGKNIFQLHSERLVHHFFVLDKGIALKFWLGIDPHIVLKIF